MPSSPSVSVIIATYNYSEVLQYSIGSVLRQTYKDFELLVVGDGCTDDSEKVVSEFRDPRVQWINLPACNKTQAGPNNEGIKRAQGQFIFYLGHDDLWLPNHLHVMVEELKKGATLAYSLAVFVGAQEHKTLVWPPFQYKALTGLPPSAVAHSALAIKKVGYWKMKDQLNGTPCDLELWNRFYLAGLKFQFIPRLTVIKFPAFWRKNIYRDRPSYEQKAWNDRISREPELERTLLLETAQLLSPKSLADAPAPPKLYKELAADFLSETLFRAKQRILIPWKEWRSHRQIK